MRKTWSLLATMSGALSTSIAWRGESSRLREEGDGKGKNGAEGKNTYPVGGEEVPTPGDGEMAVVPEETSPETGRGEFSPTVDTESYPTENGPWAAYYTQDCTPRAWMTFLASTQTIYDATYPESQKWNV